MTGNRFKRTEATRQQSRFQQQKATPAELLDMACGRKHTVYLERTAPGLQRLIGLGKNNNGQLGLCRSDTDTEDAQAQVLFIERPELLLGVAAGTNWTLVWSEKQLWASGRNDRHQLGLCQQNVMQFTRVPLDYKNNNNNNYRIRQVACGGRHTLVLIELLDSGETRLFGCGENSQGQLGSIGETGTVKELTEVREAPSHIRTVSCGDNHTVLLTQDDRLYVAGDNCWGQLGFDRDETPSLRRFTKVRTGHLRIRQVACGARHTVLLTEQSELWVTGDNAVGQLGLDYEETPTVTRFTRLEDDLPCPVRVACGDAHTVVMTATNTLYGCGENTRGQLGLSVCRRCVRRLQPLRLEGEMDQ
jgi:alpha-tubulin suppressor-like RCC1 family protein